jgi:hypothetical protein
MGTVVSIQHAKQKSKRKQRPEQAQQEAPEHYTEEEELESWKLYVRQSWRPVRDVKRGAVGAVFKVAYRDSEQGTDWLKACPIDLVSAALPSTWDAQNLDAATYLTQLFLDYLWRTGLISEQDKNFQHQWSYAARDTLAALLNPA